MTNEDKNILEQLEDIERLANKIECYISEDHNYYTIDDYIAITFISDKIFMYMHPTEVESYDAYRTEFLDDYRYFNYSRLKILLDNIIHREFLNILSDICHINNLEEIPINKVVDKFTKSKALRTTLLETLKHNYIISSVNKYCNDSEDYYILSAINKLIKALKEDYTEWIREYREEIERLEEEEYYNALLYDIDDENSTNSLDQNMNDGCNYSNEEYINSVIESEFEPEEIESEFEFEEFGPWELEWIWGVKEGYTKYLTVEVILAAILRKKCGLLTIENKTDMEELLTYFYYCNPITEDKLRNKILSPYPIDEFIQLVYRSIQLIRYITKNFNTVTIPMEYILRLQFWTLKYMRISDDNYANSGEKEIKSIKEIIKQVKVLVNFIRDCINKVIMDEFELSRAWAKIKCEEYYIDWHEIILYYNNSYRNEYLDFLVECTNYKLENKKLDTLIKVLIRDGIYVDGMDIEETSKKLRIILGRECNISVSEGVYSKGCEMLYNMLGFIKRYIGDSLLYYRTYPEIFNLLLTKYENSNVDNKREEYTLDYCIIVCLNILKSLTLEELHEEIKKGNITEKFVSVFTRSVKLLSDYEINTACSKNWVDTRSRDYIIKLFLSQLITLHNKSDKTAWEQTNYENLLTLITGSNSDNEEVISILYYYLFKDNIYEDSLMKIADPEIYKILIEYDWGILK